MFVASFGHERILFYSRLFLTVHSCGLIPLFICHSLTLCIIWTPSACLSIDCVVPKNTCEFLPHILCTHIYVLFPRCIASVFEFQHLGRIVPTIEVVEGLEKTSAADDVEDIKERFPALFGRPAVRVKPSGDASDEVCSFFRSRESMLPRGLERNHLASHLSTSIAPHQHQKSTGLSKSSLSHSFSHLSLCHKRVARLLCELESSCLVVRHLVATM